MSNNTKEFKKLQDQWYAKLKKEGFKDIEQDEDHLKSYASTDLINNYTPETFAIKENYYIAAGHFLHSYEFKCKADRLIWEYHSEGKALVEIVKLLKKHRIKSYKNKVHETVKTLRNEMKKTWQR